ncbi:unnamed protein product [Paramecium primaurelia]|uniref:Uncharacterized protein n=1 Tax=Paramecium primaurelia TaxID=5886 RepID=A0A8S1JR38_PARPR|nr:unnamed protein product [Paramecium primaurelia]
MSINPPHRLINDYKNQSFQIKKTQIIIQNCQYNLINKKIYMIRLYDYINYDNLIGFYGRLQQSINRQIIVKIKLFHSNQYIDGVKIYRCDYCQEYIQNFFILLDFIIISKNSIELFMRSSKFNY